MIRGYHIYIENIWTPELGKVLTTKKEDGNIQDRFTCGVYFRVASISLVVDVGGGVSSRVPYI